VSDEKKFAPVIPISRQARRAAERAAKDPSTPVLDKLLAAARPGIMQSLQRRDVTPADDILLVLINSPINELLAPAERLQVNQIGVNFTKRATFVRLIEEKLPSLADEIRVPPACGHFWVLLGTRSDGRYCCLTCDLKIDREKIS
jgi:hypothetical protein